MKILSQILKLAGIGLLVLVICNLFIGDLVSSVYLSIMKALIFPLIFIGILIYPRKLD